MKLFAVFSPVVFLVTALSLCLSVSALNSDQLLKQTEKSSLNSIIKLTKNNFERILGGPRDSHILVLLTATNPQIGCTLCSSIQPEFEKLARSWFKDHPQGDNLFFARADFADGHTEIFQKFQLNNVPKLFLYSPTEEPQAFNTAYDVLNIPQASDEFAGFTAEALREITKKDIHIHEELNVSGIITTFFSAFITVLLMKKYNNAVRSILASRPLWGGAVVFSILLFISGYMFNIIRNSPYVRPAGPNGEIEYFMRGQQTQLGVETQILGFIYAILAFSVVSLVSRVEKIKNEKVHFVVIAVLSGIILIFFSILISIFQHKAGGYPFQLLKVGFP